MLDTEDFDIMCYEITKRVQDNAKKENQNKESIYRIKDV